jgi:hypothetical protein
MLGWRADNRLEWRPMLVIGVLLLSVPSLAARRVRPLVVSPYLRGYNGALPGGMRGYNTNRSPYGRNNRRTRGRNLAGAVNRSRASQPRTQNKFRRDVPIDLDTALPSLQERHTALVNKLPPDIRRFDARALGVVNQLPKVAQYSYLSTLEDYDTLSPDEQGRVGKLIRSLAGLGSHEPDLVASASRSFGALGASAASTPHETCFKLQDEVDRVKGAAAPR